MSKENVKEWFEEHKTQVKIGLCGLAGLGLGFMGFKAYKNKSFEIRKRDAISLNDFLGTVEDANKIDEDVYTDLADKIVRACVSPFDTNISRKYYVGKEYDGTKKYKDVFVSITETTKGFD